MSPTLRRVLREWHSLALGLSGIALTIAVFWASRHYPSIPWASGGPPGDYPRILAVVLGVLSLLVLGQALRDSLHGRCGEARSLRRLPPDAIWRIVAATALLLLSPALLHGLGFVITGTIVCLFMMLCAAEWSRLRLRSIAWMASIALGAVLALQFAFEDFGGKRLPTGTWLSGGAF